MTFSNQTNRVSATGSGAVGQLIPFSFPISDTSDLIVTKRTTSTGAETTLTETTNYTVSISGDSGGTVTTVTAIETTEQIHIVRSTPLTQLLDLEQGGSFNAENIEDAIDKNTKLAIENNDAIERTLVFPTTDPSSSFTDMPNSVDRASKNLTFDSDGKPTASVSIETGSATFSDFGVNMVEAANADTARGVIGLDTDDDVEFAETTTADLITKSPWVDVRAYGATGDGVTDDRAAIQDAIDYAVANDLPVFFPSGHYNITTSALTVTPTANKTELVMYGVGSTSQIYQATTNIDLLTIGHPAGTYSMYKVSVSNLNLATAAGTGTALTMHRTTQFSLDNIHIMAAGKYGLYISSSCYGTVKDCHFSVNGEANFGRTSDAPTDAWAYTANRTDWDANNLTPAGINWISCEFSGDGDSDTCNGLQLGTGSYANNIIGCVFENIAGSGYAFYASGATACSMVGSFFEGLADTDAGCNNVLLTGCFGFEFQALCTSTKVELDASYGCKISGRFLGATSDIIINADCYHCSVDNVVRTGSEGYDVRNASRTTYFNAISKTATGSGTYANLAYGLQSKGYQLLSNGCNEWTGTTEPKELVIEGSPTITKCGIGLTDTETLFSEANSTNVALVELLATDDYEGLKFILPYETLGQWISVEGWIKVVAGTPKLVYAPSGNEGALSITAETGEWAKFQMSIYHSTGDDQIIIGSGDEAEAVEFYLGAVNIWCETDPYPPTQDIFYENDLVSYENDKVTYRQNKP